MRARIIAFPAALLMAVLVGPLLVFAKGKDGGAVHALTATYRRDAKAVYDPIVARMARSLRASR
jgi:hypothetical protein